MNTLWESNNTLFPSPEMSLPTLNKFSLSLVLNIHVGNGITVIRYHQATFPILISGINKFSCVL